MGRSTFDFQGRPLTSAKEQLQEHVKLKACRSSQKSGVFKE